MDAYEKHLVLKAISLIASNIALEGKDEDEFFIKFINHLYNARDTQHFDTDFEITSAIDMCMNDADMVKWISERQLRPVRNLLSALNKLFEALGYQTYSS